MNMNFKNQKFYYWILVLVAGGFIAFPLARSGGLKEYFIPPVPVEDEADWTLTKNHPKEGEIDWILVADNGIHEEEVDWTLVQELSNITKHQFTYGIDIGLAEKNVWVLNFLKYDKNNLIVQEVRRKYKTLEELNIDLPKLI